MKPAVACVSFTPIYGGGEVFIERWVSLLREDFEIYAIVCNETLEERMREAGTTVRRIPEDGAWARFRTAKQHLRELAERATVCAVLLNGQAEAMLVPWCRRLGLRTVVARHTELNFQSNFVKRAAYRRNAARADAVVCVSRCLASQHKGVVTAEKLHVVPHWVRPREVPRVRSGAFNVLYVGRLEEPKGVLELTQAARRLPDMRFVLAGEGELKERLQGDPSLRNTQCVGFQRDLQALYATADVLVHPSRAEGSSLVALEAMAAGVPCLLSDIPALRELAEGGAAALFPSGDAEALAGKLRDLEKSATLRTKLVQAAGEKLPREHSPEAARGAYSAILLGEQQPAEVCRAGREAVE
ncbi:MAG TPA: glycosyltransferase family 4 protein [Candidatus Koribacter sp.]|jgi:glycosyltransferase involved in cell wall biosynthesis